MIASIPEKKKTELAKQIPADRSATASEIAAAVAFLASDEAPAAGSS